MGDKKTDLLPGTLDVLILKTLTRGRMHGYGIAKNIKLMSDDVLEVEEGSLYPALQRLLIEGYVDAEWGKSENNRRSRYYRLTPEGRKRLTSRVSELEHMLGAFFKVLGMERGF